jgi:hypothetical protein
LVFVVASGVAASQEHSSISLEQALNHLDASARDFHSLSADVERTKVTVVVDDKSTESGTIIVRGEKMRLDLKEPDPRTILRTGDSLFIFNPKLNRVEEYNLGKYKAFADQYLLLGFGTPGHELKKGYLVTMRGEPVLDGNSFSRRVRKIISSFATRRSSATRRLMKGNSSRTGRAQRRSSRRDSPHFYQTIRSLERVQVHPKFVGEAARVFPEAGASGL